MPLLNGFATRERILAKLDEVAANASPEDTFIWFVSSHGTTTADGLFGVVPSDINVSKSNLISSNDILEKSKNIMTMTQLLIFDTCHSGALDTKLAGLYDARMSVLAKNMGIHLFASSQATETSSDSDGNGNGLFTGQLLAALSDRTADENGDGSLSITELGKYAKRHTAVRSVTSGTRRSAIAVGTDGKPIPPTPQTPLIMHFGEDRQLVRYR
jgi:uncharacterized caspase-like protein